MNLLVYYQPYWLSNTELEHYGVLGMKWGIRRYQNKDGSLTDAGKKKYKTKERYAAVKTRNRLLGATAATAVMAATLPPLVIYSMNAEKAIQTETINLGKRAIYSLFNSDKAEIEFDIAMKNLENFIKNHI